MSRFSVLALAIAVAGCALAGRDNGTGTDATPTPMDAPRAGDASTDAPRIDAAPIDAAIDAAPQDLCTSSATCAMPTATIAQISGDTGDDTRSESGYQSAWYSLRITEDDDDFYAVPMSASIDLTSPPGVTYDLYVYLDENDDVVTCTTIDGEKTTSGSTQEVYLYWGETGTLANDADDSRTAMIEIVPEAGGSCGPSAPWQLSIEGDD